MQRTAKKTARTFMTKRLTGIVILLPLTVLTTLSTSCATTGLDEAPYPYVQQGQQMQDLQRVQYLQATAQTQRIYAQQELDQMLAPIALYPDALLSQILMAATYPREVIEAAYWSQANPGLSGEQAVQAVQQANWDSSVRSLVAFPQILKIMLENPRWVESLGEAFMAQQTQVMSTIQSLRQRAMSQGSLRSNEQIYVFPQGQTITIEPVNPQIVYVPYYDPNVVYGQWWWAGYPPVYWQPWPGYYTTSPDRIRPGYPGYSPGLAWSVGIAVGSGFFFGLFDWHQHRVYTRPDYQNHYRNDWSERRPPPPHNAPPPVWRHAPERRGDTPYRQPPPQTQSVRPAAPSPTPTLQSQPIPPAIQHDGHDNRGSRGNQDSRRQEPAPQRPPATTVPQPAITGTTDMVNRGERAAPASQPVQPAQPEVRGRVQPRLGPAVRPDPGSQPPTPEPLTGRTITPPLTPAPAVAPQAAPSALPFRGGRDFNPPAAAPATVARPAAAQPTAIPAVASPATVEQHPHTSDSRTRPETAPDRAPERSDRADHGERSGHDRDHGDGLGDRSPRQQTQ